MTGAYLGIWHFRVRCGSSQKYQRAPVCSAAALTRSVGNNERESNDPDFLGSCWRFLTIQRGRLSY